MELQTVLLIWNAGNTLTLTAIAVSNYFTARAKAAHDTVRAVDDKASTLNVRVTAIEEHMKHAPSKEQLDVLHKRITELSDGTASLKATVAHVSNTLDLIHTYLLNGGRDK